MGRLEEIKATAENSLLSMEENVHGNDTVLVPHHEFWSKFQVRDWVTSKKYTELKNKVEKTTFAEKLLELLESPKLYDAVIFLQDDQTQNIRYFLNKTDIWEEDSLIYWLLENHEFCNPTSTFKNAKNYVHPNNFPKIPDQGNKRSGDALDEDAKCSRT